MAAAPESAGSNGFIGWIDKRFPLTALWRSQVSEYYAPKNFNFWYRSEEHTSELQSQ